MAKLQSVLSGAHENHIAPFLWIHGSEDQAYLDEIAAIYDSGIRDLCVEARPHEDFNGPGWFHDLELILSECKRRGMGMWLLDDSHFPTGYANGEVKEKHPELTKRFLSCSTFDVLGPVTGSQLNLKYNAMMQPGETLAVVAMARTEDDQPDPSTIVDLTPTLHVRDDYMTGRPATNPLGEPLGFDEGPCPVVDLELGEGYWYVFVLKVSEKGGEKETEGYLNPIDAAATQVLLDVVYQPVYDHFADEFGKTFRGFFSDEPRFGNIHGSEGASIGRNPAMPLPWRSDLAELLAARLGGTALAEAAAGSVVSLLPLLFVGDVEECHVIRHAYMDLVSQLYSDNFDGVIAAWCHEHGVEHIGHTIEDNNAVARLGYGPGHTFRAMANQDMAGIDVVMEQLMPGYDRGFFRGFHKPGWEAEFFTYVLGKLGGSLAHLDRKKAGRCMCEVFGAYGWAEGNRLAKWIADYMLVRGVNEFVPHAFSPKAFPDGDCPPHFFAHGKNPQYPEFRLLMDYMNRMATLLSGGSYNADVALYLNAESEWSGEYMLTQRPAAELSRNQIEYDLVSADYLVGATVGDGRVRMGEESFRAVVLPYGEAMPAEVIRTLARVAAAGIPVWFVDALPSRSSEGVDVSSELADLAAGAVVVPLAGLAAAVRAAGVGELSSSCYQPFLRTYHYVVDGVDEYLLVNEHPSRRVTCELAGAVAGKAYVYDAFANTLTADPQAFSLDLAPYESRMVIVSPEGLAGAQKKPRALVVRESLELGACAMSLAGFDDDFAWGQPVRLDRAAYVSGMDGHESFCGLVRYEFAVELSAEQVASARANGARLVLEGVREAATVTVNGSDCGTRIVGDYAFDVAPGLVEGTNVLLVQTNTTLGRAMDDFVGQFVPLEPTGMTGATLLLG